MTTIDTSTQVLDEIQARVAAVTGWRVHVGAVTDGPAMFYPDDDGTVVKTVTITDGDQEGRDAERSRRLDNGSNLAIRLHTLGCWMGPVAPDTYVTFRAALGTLRDSLIADPMLGSVAYLSPDRLPEIQEITYDPLEQFLCHYASIVIETLAEEHWR